METLLQLRQETGTGILQAPITKALLSDQLNTDTYAKYLLNVWHYARFSSRVIALAGSRAVETHPQLANYLFHHAQEEMGHDEWVIEDLINLGWNRKQIISSRATLSCESMIAYEFYIAGICNPIALFGWLYILEAIGDDLGSEIANKIASHPATKNSVKFVAGHGVADEEHTADLTKMISTYIKGEDEQEVIHVARVVKNLYVNMFHEL